MTPQEAREILSKINISVGMGESEEIKMRQVDADKAIEIWKEKDFIKFVGQEEKAKMLLDVLPTEPRWIPIKMRPMTEEEKEHFFEYADSRCDDTYTILDCPLPDDGQEVILSVNGYVDTDIFCRDSADGCYFESYDIDDVEAWMPLPSSYQAESEE